MVMLLASSLTIIEYWWWLSLCWVFVVFQSWFTHSHWIWRSYSTSIFHTFSRNEIMSMGSRYPQSLGGQYVETETGNCFWSAKLINTSILLAVDGLSRPAVLEFHIVFLIAKHIQIFTAISINTHVSVNQGIVICCEKYLYLQKKN